VYRPACCQNEGYSPASAEAADQARTACDDGNDESMPATDCQKRPRARSMPGLSRQKINFMPCSTTTPPRTTSPRECLTPARARSGRICHTIYGHRPAGPSALWDLRDSGAGSNRLAALGGSVFAGLPKSSTVSVTLTGVVRGVVLTFSDFLRDAVIRQRVGRPVGPLRVVGSYVQKNVAINEDTATVA
jgi:hypothetical protein